MAETITKEDIEAYLGWFAAMGVREHVQDQPADWFAVPAAVQPPPRQAAAQPVAPQERAAAKAQPAIAASRPARTLSPDKAAMAAREEARAATSLTALRELLERFEGCALKATAKSLCFFRGAERSRLMLIGEAPGRDEDIAGKPFVGRAGQLLDKMLASIGLGENDVHIANIVYWRPPGNRTPTPQEAQVCAPFLARQIELVAPELIMILGGAAAKQLLDTPEGIMKLRGKWRPLPGDTSGIRVLATLHPAYLLRTPAHKRLAWRDLLAVEAALANRPS